MLQLCVPLSLSTDTHAYLKMTGCTVRSENTTRSYRRFLQYRSTMDLGILKSLELLTWKDDTDRHLRSGLNSMQRYKAISHCGRKMLDSNRGRKDWKIQRM